MRIAEKRADIIRKTPKIYHFHRNLTIVFRLAFYGEKVDNKSILKIGGYNMYNSSLVENLCLVRDSIQKNTITREEALQLICNNFDNSGNVYNHLIAHNFHKAPASLHYHGDYDGGLFDHSLAVTICLVNMTDAMNLQWEVSRSPLVVGLLHDVCKTENYKMSEDGWVYADKTPFPGHGVKSLLLLQDWGIELTKEERVCILHHMGAYEKGMWDEYDAAIRMFPNVLWTHHADMYASKIVGI